MLQRHLRTLAIFVVRAATLLLTGAIALASCAPTEPGESAPTETLPPSTIEIEPSLPAALPLVTIAHEAPLGDHPTDPLYTVVVHPDEWSELQGQLPEAAIHAGLQAGPEQDSLIVVGFAGAKGTSGYSLTVESVIRDQDWVIVTVSQQSPESGTIVEPAMTLPYHLVAVPREALASAQGLTVEFRDPEGIVLERKELLVP